MALRYAKNLQSGLAERIDDPTLASSTLARTDASEKPLYKELTAEEFDKENAPKTEAKVRTVAPTVDSVLAEYDKMANAETPTKEQLRSQALRDIQTQLDAQTAYYNAQRRIEQDRLSKQATLNASKVNALGLARGLTGSSVAEAEKATQATESADLSAATMAKLAADEAAAKSSITSGATKTADEQYAAAVKAKQDAMDKRLAFMEKQATAAAEKPVSYTLSPGQKIFDAEGKLIAENSKENPDLAPKVLNPGDTLVDSTGKVIYTAPAKPTAPTIKEIDGKTYTIEADGTSKPFVPAVTEADKATAKASPDSPANILRILTEIKNDPNKALGIGSVVSLIPGTKAYDFNQKINQLKTLMALPNLKLLKGAMSDRDVAFIQSAGTSLSTGMTPEAFNAELDRLIANITPIAANFESKMSGVEPAPTETKTNTISQDEINALKASGATDAEIQELLKAEGGGQTASKTQNAKTIAAAIKKVESGGNYNAKGASGENGAYQFMPATWRGWAKTYLGDPNAPLTPQNQDKVAEMHIQSLLDQGKTPEQIALIWNGGQPIRKKGVNSMGVAYDSGAYADKVLANL